MQFGQSRWKFSPNYERFSSKSKNNQKKIWWKLSLPKRSPGQLEFFLTDLPKVCDNYPKNFCLKSGITTFVNLLFRKMMFFFKLFLCTRILSFSKLVESFPTKCCYVFPQNLKIFMEIFFSKQSFFKGLFFTFEMQLSQNHAVFRQVWRKICWN